MVYARFERNTLKNTILKKSIFSEFFCREVFQFFYSFYTDINECLEGDARCEHNCANTQGSYACGCNRGYTLHSNGRSCIGELF